MQSKQYAVREQNVKQNIPLSSKQATSRSTPDLSGEGNSHHVMFTKGILYGRQKAWHACLTHLPSVLPGHFRQPALSRCEHCCLNEITRARMVSGFSYGCWLCLVETQKRRKTDWVVRCWLANTVTELLLAWTRGEIDWPMRITEDRALLLIITPSVPTKEKNKKITDPKSHSSNMQKHICFNKDMPLFQPQHLGIYWILFRHLWPNSELQTRYQLMTLNEAACKISMPFSDQLFVDRKINTF